MTKKFKNILSIISGGLITLIILGLIIGVFAFFWMLHLGYEPIPEIRDYIWTYLFGLILLILVIIPFQLLRKKRPYFSYGLLIGLLPIGLIFYLNTSGLYEYLTPDDFDKKIWIDSNPKPYEMARSLIKNNLTDSLTRQEVIELLGADYSKNYSDDSTLVYQLDIASFAYIEIHFDKKGMVKRTNYIYND
jgi:hypothetical protein